MKTRNILLPAIFAVLSTWAHAQVIQGKPTLKEWQEKEFDFVELKDDRFRLTADEVKEFYPEDPQTADPGAKLRKLYDSQRGLENLYGRLRPGPIPDGAYKGSVILPRKGRYEIFFRIAALFKYPFSLEKTEALMQKIWLGKSFDKKNKTLMNEIVRPEVLAFPAQLHCGISMLAKTEPSVIIDYAFSDELGHPLYEELRDKIVTRHGVNIRDEIRMITPGLYLGRAYMDGVFALNFVLFRSEVTDSTNECGTPMPGKTAGYLRGDI